MTHDVGEVRAEQARRSGVDRDDPRGLELARKALQVGRRGVTARMLDV